MATALYCIPPSLCTIIEEDNDMLLLEPVDGGGDDRFYVNRYDPGLILDPTEEEQHRAAILCDNGCIEGEEEEEEEGALVAAPLPVSPWAPPSTIGDVYEVAICLLLHKRAWHASTRHHGTLLCQTCFRRFRPHHLFEHCIDDNY